MQKTLSSEFTAVIADDEPWLRQEIQQQLLTSWPELKILATCADGKETLIAIETYQPDVIFLDIHMPFFSGLEVIETLIAQQQTLPYIVFITAYNQYAIEAFHRNAVDYLLKPVKKQRLLETLTRLKTLLNSQAHTTLIENYQAQLKTLQEELDKHNTPIQKTSTQHLQHINVTLGQKRFMVDMQDVLYIQSDKKYSKLITYKGEYLIRESLQDLEKQLDASVFWRIHRSTLLNIRYLDYCTPTMTGRLEASLKDYDIKLTISRTYLSKFKGL